MRVFYGGASAAPPFWPLLALRTVCKGRGAGGRRARAARTTVRGPQAPGPLVWLALAPAFGLAGRGAKGPPAAKRRRPPPPGRHPRRQGIGVPGGAREKGRRMEMRRPTCRQAPYAMTLLGTPAINRKRIMAADKASLPMAAFFEGFPQRAAAMALRIARQWTASRSG